MRKISIIDYGIGNVLSVRRAFEKQKADVEFISDADAVMRAEKLVLPGVGAFKDGMKELEKRNLVFAIQEYCRSDRPFLGICLGMQMMMDESEEFGQSKGLGIISGNVIRIEDTAIDGTYQKVPHVGWNALVINNIVENTILEGIPEYSGVYFVHSYKAVPKDEKYRLADVYYGGRKISAVLRKGNCFGTQFHPEKSGEIGLKMICNFINL